MDATARPPDAGPLAARWAVAGLAALFWGLALVFALQTPPWQAPDEPAHFNYVLALARGELPVLVAGDWDAAYLAAAVSARFRPPLEIDRLRYEAHQPPVYYALLALPAVLAQDLEDRTLVYFLRALGALLGLPLLALAWQIGRRLATPWLALAAVAWITLLPQHLAITASINNDILGELAAASVVLWTLVAVAVPRLSRRLLVIGALIVALVLLAKTTAYTSLALVPLGLMLRSDRGWRTTVLQSGLVLGGGLLLAAPWFVRNVLVYGAGDPLGQVRHDAIVVGQPGGRLDTVAGWLDVLTIGFRSFFVQLGWMGVPAEDRVYWVLAVLTGLAAGGLLALAPGRRWRPPTVVAVMAVALVLMAALAYNLRFFQPQGRYLFAALPLLALGSVVGAAALAPARWRWVGPAAWLVALGWVTMVAIRDLLPALR